MKSNQEINITNTQIEIKAKLNPTEDQTKVENSIQNMMGEKITLRKTEDNYLICEDNLSILSKINHMIIKNEMEDFAKNILEKNRTDTTITFYINKQSALKNNFHMIDENMSSLGDIEVKIKTDNPDEIIKWIIS